MNTLTKIGWGLVLGAGALAVTGCNNQQEIRQIERQLAVSPGLVDLNEVAIGEEVEFTLQLDHVAGQIITIRGVDVFNVEGDYFFVEGEYPTVDRNETKFLTLTYLPEEEGYHRAVVTVTSDAERTPQLSVDVRAHAVAPEISIWPAVLDFGPVDNPDTAVLDVTIANDGDLDLEITQANFGNSDFLLEGTLPIAVPHGQQVDVGVMFAPTDDAQSTGTVYFDLGEYVQSGQVALRGNACAIGAPQYYDVDGDGWTSCGGDCDDDRADVFPGAPEAADGYDQDCDSDIDEGTGNFDDDGDCHCEGSGCLGSINSGCASLELGDCNDGAAAVNPSATEIIGNGIDDDCDNTVDQGTEDQDSDGYSPGGGDCDDNDPTRYPNAPELPDGLDNDCSAATEIDEGTVLFDDDGDGYCEAATATCRNGALNGDCDDNAEDADFDSVPDGYDTHPNAPELEDGRDNNCDGSGPGGSNKVDEGTNADDTDGDGFSENGGDCNDGNPFVNPGQVEIINNGIDDDCNPLTLD